MLSVNFPSRMVSPAPITVTLDSSQWGLGLTQKVTVTGVLADETAQEIHIMPAVGDIKAFIDAGIYWSAQEADSLTFTCDSAPEGNITLYVTIWPLAKKEA